jgi:hypothetical protein
MIDPSTAMQQIQWERSRANEAENLLREEKAARLRDQGDFHRRVREQEAHWRAKMHRAATDRYWSHPDDHLAQLEKENATLRKKVNQLRQQKGKWKRLYEKERQARIQDAGNQGRLREAPTTLHTYKRATGHAPTPVDVPGWKRSDTDESKLLARVTLLEARVSHLQAVYRSHWWDAK